MESFRFSRPAFGVLAAVGLAGVAIAPARANDCADLLDVLKGMTKLTYHQSVSRVASDGKTTGGQIVQTPSARYVEVRGVWHKLPTATEEFLRKAETMVAQGKMTCQRKGNDTLNGKTAVVYAVHSDGGDNPWSDSKVWVESGQRLLKSESKSDGAMTTSQYDYDKVEVPTNAVPLGQTK